MWWTFLACGRAPTPELPPTPRHGDGWAALAAAVERGDVAAAKALARDVSLGPLDDGSAPTTALGGALGYLQVVDDAEEARDAFAEARGACDDCHAARGAAPVR
jgi:hypothetical protein